MDDASVGDVVVNGVAGGLVVFLNVFVDHVKVEDVIVDGVIKPPAPTKLCTYQFLQNRDARA